MDPRVLLRGTREDYEGLPDVLIHFDAAGNADKDGVVDTDAARWQSKGGNSALVASRSWRTPGGNLGD